MTDSDQGGLSQEEIAHKFNLPERQAKVNTLIKTMENEGEQKYCICQSTDCTSFMIACDKCEEWYHGVCIGVTQIDAKSIKKYYCDACRGKDPSLEIRYKVKKPWKEKGKSDSSDIDRSARDPRLRETNSKAKKSSRRCGDCTACNRKEDCGRCDYCKDMKKFGGPNKMRQKCRLRQCANFGLAILGLGQGPTPSPGPGTKSKDDDYNPALSDGEIDDDWSENNYIPKKKEKRSSSSEASSPRKYRKKDKRKEKHKKNTTKSKTQKSVTTSKKKRFKVEEPMEMEEETPKQCYGPGCKECARSGSKYCSDACGLKLAKSRIYEMLPSRIQQWQSSLCVAEEKNKKSLESIRREQLVAKQRLNDLDLRHKELDSLIEKAKHLKIDPNQGGAEPEDDTEITLYCVTCGSEINQRGALRHMEKCFSKFESQTSFGSIYKTRIEGNSMFCDFWNPQQKFYCKRLKVLCPEHTKEPKIGQDEVCGCPLVVNVFEETGELCRAPKRKCIKHYCWEKLRRAEVDMERLRQWMALDDLFEKERNIRLSMSNRMGVLGLMLHQSVDHDPMTPMTATQVS
ncbi:hypothetical protein SNE40_015210 [Patella caerulea]|uniref:CXXC-type zinc finger protein 1 n=1 Tax=Patella caerulea TaxID=87958 RepID=A0AAN8JLR3_PATCE